jgi:hypothetical protein
LVNEIEMLSQLEPHPHLVRLIAQNIDEKLLILGKNWYTVKIAALRILIRIRIRVHRIHMLLGLTDPDPFIIKQNK